jgi:hypothetical protein
VVEYVCAWTPTKARWKTSGRRAENIVVREKDDGVEETQGFKLSRGSAKHYQGFLP